MNVLQPFKEVWLVDFEFTAQAGERPSPVCMVARELRSGRLTRIWKDELHSILCSPFSTDPDVLFVAYYASAELGCFKALNWAMPSRILDLFCEFRCLTSGLDVPFGDSLLGALANYGISGLSTCEKDRMRDKILCGGPYTSEEESEILDYCQSDVDALEKLLSAMEDRIDLPRALLRGRYMAALACMEWTGTPIDTEILSHFRENWEAIKAELISWIDQDYGIYEGGAFKEERWARWIEKNRIPWPRNPSGSLCLKDETFKEMSLTFPKVAPIRELRKALAQLRCNDLAVGADGRNRCMLSAFRSKTGRNQPSNSKFIFGLSTWLRSLIRPEPGMALAYIDWSQQELGIAAALSGDKKMQDAYHSGDFYMTFAKMAGAVPMDGTKESHPNEREQFKAVALGVLYGLSEYGLAPKLNVPEAHGRELLRMHKETFRQFWRWSDSVENEAILSGRLQTVFGWTVHTGNSPNLRSLRNFPMQGNGAEMMRLACCLATERGIRVCAPIHDALLIEATSGEIEEAVKATEKIMVEASRMVLGGFQLRTDVKVIRYPERFSDQRGAAMWKIVNQIIGESCNA